MKLILLSFISIHRQKKNWRKIQVKTPFFYKFGSVQLRCCLFLNNGEIIDDGPEKFSNISSGFPTKGYYYTYYIFMFEQQRGMDQGGQIVSNITYL